MHTLKSLFISVYLMALLAAAGVALWQIATDGTAAWWGVLLAAAVPLGFFTWVFVGSVARTGDTLWWVPAAGTFGTAVSASIGGLSTPTWVAMAVGMVMGALYTRWYSRFGERSAPQLMAGQPLPDFPLENLDGTPLRSTAPSITSEPMPTRQRSSIVQPCRMTLWPMVTSAPTVSGSPAGLSGVAWFTCSTEPSWTLVRAPMRMRFTSPRSTENGHTEASSASST